MLQKAKICYKCKTELPATADCFNRAKRKKDGLNIWCKQCCKEYRQQNKEHIKKCQKEWWKKNRERYRNERRSYSLGYNYGITIEQYNKIFESQNGVCLICGKSETRKRKGNPTQLVVDHCHASGGIRGLLCSNCNSRLGWYERCQEKIESYLKNN